jgi:phosphoribosylanthranilate isomerase
MVFSFSFFVAQLARHPSVAAQRYSWTKMKTWIKFCGTTCLPDALASVDAGADALGFIFATSKRRITKEVAKEIIAAIPREVERVGIFIDEDQDSVQAIASEAGLTAVQLHGDESPEYVAAVKQRRINGTSLRVIKTVLMNDDFPLMLEKFIMASIPPDAILLDSGAGSGRTFDWRGVRSFLTGTDMKFIVAGGLNPDNVAAAVEYFHPWGVDVVSGVESEPGRKDPGKLKQFVAAVRNAEKPNG